MDQPEDRFRQGLTAGRRALALQDLRLGSATAVLVSGILALLLGFSSLLQGSPLAYGWWLVVVLGGLLALSVEAARPGWSDTRVAARLDRAEGAESRYSTGLALRGLPDRTPMEELALAECAGWVAGQRGRLPVRKMPRRLMAGGAGLWALGLLLFFAAVSFERARPDADAFADALEQAADRLQNPQGQVATAADLAQLQEQLRAEAERLRDGNSQTPGEDAEKALSRASARLEAGKRSLSNGGMRDEELTALQEAAGRQPDGEDLQSALEAGDLEAASERAAELPSEQSANALLDAAARLPQQASSLMSQLAQQASQGNQDLSEMLSEAIRRSEEARRQAEQLAQMQSALSDMQMDLRPSGQAGSGPSSEEQQQMLAAIGRQQQQQGNQQESAGFSSSKPTGKPGSEQDTGTTLDPFGGKDDVPPPSDLLSFIQGASTDGPIESSSAETDNQEAQVRSQWREVQAAAEQRAAESVATDSVPPNARRLVRRYFEQIRPETSPQ